MERCDCGPMQHCCLLFRACHARFAPMRGSLVLLSGTSADAPRRVDEEGTGKLGKNSKKEGGGKREGEDSSEAGAVAAPGRAGPRRRCAKYIITIAHPVAPSPDCSQWVSWSPTDQAPHPLTLRAVLARCRRSSGHHAAAKQAAGHSTRKRSVSSAGRPSCPVTVLRSLLTVSVCSEAQPWSWPRMACIARSETST